MSDERNTMDELNSMNMPEGQAEEGTTAETAAISEPGIDELKAQVVEFKDKYLRAMAEMENMKKRQQRLHADVVKYGKESVVKDFLLVYDAIEKSIVSAQNLYPDDEPFISGLHMIERLLLETLKKHGVEPIQTRDMAFDPNIHEAMMQIPRPDLQPGMVVDEIERGFILNERVLRAAKVTVSV